MLVFFFFKQNTSDGMRISDWSSDVCSSDLQVECVLAITTLKQELRGVMQRCVRLIVQCIDPCPPDQQPLDQCVEAQRARHHQRSNPAGKRLIDPRERRSVGEGKRVTGRVAIGGRRHVKKKIKESKKK